MGLLDELLKAQKPKRNLMGAQMVKGPDQPYLRQDYPTLYGALGGLLGTAPDEMAGSVMDPNTAAVRQGAEYGFPIGTALGVLPMARFTKGLPVGMGIKPINLEKGIYRPELTMEEMLKVKDIPTVERVRKSMELVGEKEFENMVNAQFKKYKPTDQDQEAMLVESVTLNILGKAQRTPYPQQAALDLAQQRAALPVSEGGLGLPAGNTAEQRARAMGFDFNTTRFHGSDKDIYAFDPAKFGKNDQGWYGRGVTTDTDPEIASGYANYNEAQNGQVVYPLVSRGKYMEWPEGQSPFSTAKDSIQGTKDIEGLGYQGTQVTNDRDLYGNSPQFGTEQVTFNPENIRSRFAAFDPFRRSAAIAATMGVAAPDLLAAPIDEEELRRRQSGLLYAP